MLTVPLPLDYAPVAGAGFLTPYPACHTTYHLPAAAGLPDSLHCTPVVPGSFIYRNNHGSTVTEPRIDYQFYTAPYDSTFCYADLR